MASTAAVTDQAKQDWLNGVHQPGDTYKIALYDSTATLSKSTTAYTSSGEVSGAGYSAGGTALSGFTVGLSGDIAYVDFADPSFAAATLTGVVTALIYNSSRSNKALAVITGAPASSTSDTFTVVLPAPGATGSIRIY